MRQAYDFSPLYRSMIGADRVADLIETAMRTDIDRSYPPYDIEKTADDAYRITMAVAGFTEADIDITSQENQLVVQGRIRDAQPQDGVTYLHRGIAGRAFERRFQLADHIKVTGASLENGLLTIDLVREVPEAMKPRKIAITSSTAPRLEQKAG